MKWSEYIAKREIILERFEEGKISEERMEVLLKRLDNLKLIVGIEPEVKEEEEDWIDPAGGYHYGNESDPAAMYI